MAETPAPASAPARTFKRKKSITLPTLKFVVDKPLFVLMVGKLHEGKARVGRSGNVKMDSDGNPRKPPTLVEVVDMSTGESAQLIASTIIKTEMGEAYPNDSYVGRGFEIIKQKRKEGREYDPYNIAEVEVPDEFEPIAKAAIAALKSENADVPPPKSPAPGSGSAKK